MKLSPMVVSTYERTLGTAIQESISEKSNLRSKNVYTVLFIFISSINAFKTI